MPSILRRLRQEPLFLITLLLSVLTAFWSAPRWLAIDWKVILSLFNLMVVLLAMEDLRVLDTVSVQLLRRYRQERVVSLALVALTFCSSMLITNDVALLTFVPLAIVVARRAGFNPCFLVILQTLAANLGSSLTPMGNPQNLFLYARFQIGTGRFLLTTAPMVLLGALWLLLLSYRIPRRELQFDLERVTVTDQRCLVVYALLFLAVLLSILRVLPYQLASVLTIGVVLFWDRRLLPRVDYFLLGTFICFFLFIDNLTRIPAISSYMRSLLATPGRTYLTGALLSQGISNVPSAIMLAGFTPHWPALLLGVNIGGMGTLIASLASVISYRLYAKAYPENRYLSRFHLLSLVSLLLLGSITYLLI